MYGKETHTRLETDAREYQRTAITVAPIYPWSWIEYWSERDAAREFSAAV